MLWIDKKKLEESLKSVGLQKGDTVLCHCDLSKIGLMKECKNNEDYLKNLLDCLLNVLGAEGTLMVPTFSYNYARKKEPFIYEKTPSELDVFSEYVRKHKESLRSLHPIFSMTALGKNQEFLCQNVSRSSFGVHSPFDRLMQTNGKILFIGTSSAYSMTFIHYIEHMFGVSYCYHKAFFTPVFKEGKKIQGPFFCFLRYLEKVFYNHPPFETLLKERKVLSQQALGMGFLQLTHAQDVFKIAFEKLQQEPCFFIHPPYYVTH